MPQHDEPTQGEALNHDELMKALSTELDPNLDYFDGTECFKALAEQLRNEGRLLRHMIRHNITLGQSLIKAKQEIIELKADLAAAGIGKAGQKSAIIMPRKGQ